jgi:ubiquinone/menaquinone biosynthesis C-methylase UbiE
MATDRPAAGQQEPPPAWQHPAWRRDTFDRQAQEFGRGPTAFFWEFGARLVALARVRPGERALDAAAGTGAVSVPLAAAGARVVAVDLSGPMLAQLRAPAGVAPGAGPVWPVRAAAQALPCRGGWADVLTCGFGIAFFPDLPAALGEFRRVLRPGGRLALTWWLYEARTPFVVGAELAAERSAPARRSWEHARALAAPEDVRAVVRRAGFPAVRAERLTVEWATETFDAWWGRWVQQWAASDRPVGPDEAPALRARLERDVAPWIGADGALRYPLDAFAIVAGAD